MIPQLIRTGSAEHNRKLCSMALKKGMKLHADGRGLYKDDEMVSNTEEGILQILLGKYVKPEKRD